MRVCIDENSGFCFGVDRAVNLVNELIEQNQKVCTLGPIIHNPQMVENLRQRGVVSVDALENVPEDYTVVIRSHGVPESVYDYLENNGIKYLDATCPFVSKIHKIVNENSKNGEVILIAGNEKHPEVQGIMGHCNGETFVFADAAIRRLLADIQIEEQNHAEMLFKYKTANGMA